jgi:M6 family metalloprotease-like protein
MRFSIRREFLLGLLASVGFLSGVSAQDIELLGRIHGTRPPQGYYDLLERDAGAFQFRRALFRRGLGLRELPDIRTPGGSIPATFDRAFAQLLAESPDRASVTGTFNFPLILGLFSDSDPVLPSFGGSAVQAEFFDGPQANPSAGGTIPEFYDELSGGRVTLTGTTFDWSRTSLTQFQVSAGVSGLGVGSRVGEFIVRILESLDDGSVDWGDFDNDGPDGIPNSGDDDGFVDVLAVMHPTAGSECSQVGPEAIWSHRWNLYWNARYYGSAWTPEVNQSIQANFGYVTKTPSANPAVDFIHVLDYTIQPVRACNGTTINSIGVFAHELGHGFGLPDLYVTANNQHHEGIGNWGLMGTGSWGCVGRTAWSPCHMSPWSKEVLGWADVQTLEAGTDLGTLSLPPVETSGKVYRINSEDGSPEYLLLENRQRVGFDRYLYEPGLLIWHIDPVTVEGSEGGINNDPQRMGVWLRQADGLNDLGTQNGGRGDDGDPFPGSSGNTAFHAGANPSSWTHDGKSMGITILNIRASGQNMDFRALTRYQTVTLRTEGSPSGAGLVSVDGSPPGSSVWSVNSAPFQHHLIEAASGEEVDEGIRVAFQGWIDGGPRVREYTTGLEDATFTATYGGREFLVDVAPTSPAAGIVPGYIVFSGGDGTGWVPEGESVTVTATPRTGFDFLEWADEFYGSPNPTTVTPAGPVHAEAVFGVTFTAATNPSTATLTGGIENSVTLLAENGNYPVQWSVFSGTLPAQLVLNANGLLQGTPLRRGEFPLTLRALDGIGLQAFLPLTLVVEDPEIAAETLASAFLFSGPSLSQNAKTFLDNEGNHNMAYDLGDLRAYILRNPGLPSYGQLQSLLEIEVTVGDMKNPPKGAVKREEGP